MQLLLRYCYFTTDYAKFPRGTAPETTKSTKNYQTKLSFSKFHKIFSWVGLLQKKPPVEGGAKASKNIFEDIHFL